MPAGVPRLAAFLLMFAVSGCGGPAPSSPGAPVSASPGGSTPSGSLAPAASATAAAGSRGDPILGCTSITLGECRAVVEAIGAELPPGSSPAAIEVTLYGCADNPECAHTLAVREGEVIVEFADGTLPVMFTVTGPPNAPRVAEAEIGWSGVMFPQSRPAAGPGPFPYEVGHCGLWNVVDFDTSFWLPVGEIDGDIPAMINSEQGQIRLLTPTLAEYQGPDGSRVQLARFPGPRYLRLCM